jgi:tripartite-type tricarboxylate transporter receptor subunit TctC
MPAQRRWRAPSLHQGHDSHRGHLPAIDQRSGHTHDQLPLPIGERQPAAVVAAAKSIARACVAALTSIVASAAFSPAQAQPVADFYRGKTIEILVGAAAAGGYDVVSRVLVNHMARHVPGNPTFIVRNMPGATGLVMTNYLYNVAKRDGTAIGVPTSNVPIEPRLKLISPDGSNVKFDIARMKWLGTALQEPQVTWVWHGAPAKSVDDLKTNTILMGATSPSADNFILPSLANELLGTRMKLITGYQGQNDINIAAERGEVQGNNTGLSNLTVNKADWMRDDKIRILIQYGSTRLPALKDVPTAVELIGNDFDRTAMNYYALKFNMARPFLLPPDVPADRVAALQAAFEATMRDPLYLADAKRIGLDTNWVGGAEFDSYIRQVQETPQPVVDRLRDLLARAGVK